MRRAAKRDRAEGAIVDALRKAGCSVAYWGMDGAPDLVVGRWGVTYLLEVKNPPGPEGGCSGTGQKLNPRQVEFHGKWRGHVSIVSTPAEALLVIR